MCDLLGPMRFLRFYLAGSVVSSLVALAYNIQDPNYHSLPLNFHVLNGGANAVMVLYACCYPREAVLTYLTSPMRAGPLAIWLVGMQLIGWIIAKDDRNSDKAVLGKGEKLGLLASVLFGFIYYRRTFVK